MKYKFIILLCIFLSIFINYGENTVYADDLLDNVNEQIDNIDLTSLEDYFNSLDIKNQDFFSNLNNLIKGENVTDFNSIFSFIYNSFFNTLKNYIPLISVILSIVLLSMIFNNFKGDFLSGGISDIISTVIALTLFACIITIVISNFNYTKNIIENLSKLNEIMSPIIITLMCASGNNVSAKLYQPTVVFLSSTVIKIVNNVIIPLGFLVFILSIINNLSLTIKTQKAEQFISSLIKWILGIIFAVYGVFLSCQGISSSTYDGISFRAAKYAVTNAIPLVGGFIKEGFDVITAGSVIIKNSLGIIGIIMIFYTVITPFLTLLSLNFIFKMLSSVTEMCGDNKMSLSLNSVSNVFGIYIASILLVGFMFFISVLLMIMSGNSVFI